MSRRYAPSREAVRPRNIVMITDKVREILTEWVELEQGQGRA